MAENLDWSQDPVVQFENAVLPMQWQGQMMICDAMTTRPDSAPQIAAALAPFDAATKMLRTTATEMLLARDIRADPAALQPLAVAAKDIQTLRHTLSAELSDKISVPRVSALFAQIKDQVIPSVDAALNTYREIFITHVLAEQNTHAKQAREAIQRLDKISKQIFFISINASVEAARVGEAGRGFTQISTDIRALSQSAQAATRNLSELVRKA